MRKGKFDLEDLSDQLAQVEKIGGIGGIMGMLPGVAKMKEQLASAHVDERIIKRQRAMISSMTREERRNPDVLKASRKRRVAAGSGVKVEDVNKLLKQHRQMADMMKSMGSAKRGGAMGKVASMLGFFPAACRSQRRTRSPPCKSRWGRSMPLRRHKPGRLDIFSRSRRASWRTRRNCRVLAAPNCLAPAADF